MGWTNEFTYLGLKIRPPFPHPSSTPLRARRDHGGYPMLMDDEDGLSFGYRLPRDVTAAVRRAFLKGEASAGGAESVDQLGPFVYHAEGLTFAFVEHQGPERGEQKCRAGRRCMSREYHVRNRSNCRETWDHVSCFHITVFSSCRPLVRPCRGIR